MLDGSVHAFLGLGGNFAVAGPDTPRVLQAMEGLRLTVHIATKLNRTHLHPGQVGLLLPCLSRTERDEKAGVRQFVSVEDTASMVHASAGRGEPASPRLRSEPWIVSELARRTLAGPAAPAIDWQAMGSDYSVTRALIEQVAQTAVAGFEQYNARIAQPRGFHLPNSARLRDWRTASGKAEFSAIALPQDSIMRRARAAYGEQVLCLATVRAHRQYNTTVYRDSTGEVDRYRGVHHTRKVLFIAAATMARLGLRDGQMVDVHAAAPDGIARSCRGARFGHARVQGSAGAAQACGMIGSSWCIGASSGMVMRTVVPTPGRLSTWILPPRMVVTMLCTMFSPSPELPSLMRVVKKGSKMRFRLAGAMPAPSSLMTMSAWSPSGTGTVIDNRPWSRPRKPCSRALLTRAASTWPSGPG
jgi:anaerobic selenocysteine-containing dehydrogenase